MNAIQQLVMGLALATGASASLIIPDSGAGLPLAIADHDATGVLRPLAVSGLAPGSAYSVDVALNIQGRGDGGYVGDVYAYLAHQIPGGAYNTLVLLNRPGRSASLLSGYDNAGLNLSLSDSAAYDIHTYQAQSYQLDATGALTGTWQPDRRLANPDTVVSGDARAATTLANLVGSNANGYWYLFIADMEAGGTLQLNGWSLSFSELAAVPEPGNLLALSGLVASAMFLRSRRKRVA